MKTILTSLESFQITKPNNDGSYYLIESNFKLLKKTGKNGMIIC